MKRGQVAVRGYTRRRNGEEAQVKPHFRTEVRIGGFLAPTEASIILRKRTLNLRMMIREKKIRAVTQGKITRIPISEIIKANKWMNRISKEEDTAVNRGIETKDHTIAGAARPNRR